MKQIDQEEDNALSLSSKGIKLLLGLSLSWSIMKQVYMISMIHHLE